MYDITLDIIFNNFRAYNRALILQGKRRITFSKYLQLFY